MRPKILFLASEDRFFWGHPLPVARAALREGYEIVVATAVHSYSQQILDEGFRLIPLKFVRGGHSPANELSVIRRLRRIYAEEKPDIVHHLSLKPVLYGSIASIGRKNLKVINAVTGLGYLVASPSLKAKMLRAVIWNSLRYLLYGIDQRLIVENDEDAEMVIERIHVPRARVFVTRGAGVDVNRFCAAPWNEQLPVVLLASRMLWIKGVEEFVQAAKSLRSRGIGARFVLCGDTDPKNPSCVSTRQLLNWQTSGIVEWWGHRPDMQQVFREAAIVCLPSHGGEGIPKVLMEAAASGRPIITTNVPGCRDIVRHGLNGLVVRPKNVSELADAIGQLVNDAGRCREMGCAGRELAVAEFSAESVVQETLLLYRELLAAPVPSELVKSPAIANRSVPPVT